MNRTTSLQTWDALVGRVPDQGALVRIGDLEEGLDWLTEELCRRPAWRTERLGSLFPGMERIRSLPSDRMSRRIATALQRAELHSWRDIAQLSPLGFSTIPNLGLKSFREVIGATFEAWIDLHLGGSWGAAGADRGDAFAGRGPEAPPFERLDLDEHLADVEEVLRAMWIQLGATTLSEGVHRWTYADVPEEAAASFERLQALDLGACLRLQDADERAWRALVHFEARKALILTERVFPEGKRTTLGELGDRLGITRERVRQLEANIGEELETRRTQASVAGIIHLASWVRHRIGHAARQDTAVDVLSSAVADTSETNENELALRSRVLGWLAGPYEPDAGLVFTPTAKRLMEDARAEVASVPPGEPVGREPIAALIDRLAAGDRDLHGELIRRLGLRELGGQYVAWRGSLADKASAALSVTGHPLSMIEIHELIGLDANPRSLAGQIQGDLRIMRRGKDRYGLRSWGGEEYTGILEELEQALERAGGRADLDELVAEFVETFGVSPQSVRSYANDRRFLRNPDGTLTLRGAEEPEVSYPATPIDITAGAFRIAGIWHARFATDFDLLRGSGRPLRRGVAVAAGLEPDLTVGVAYGDHIITFSWAGNQPTIGSLRRLAQAHGCSEGDLLFLPLEGVEPRGSHTIRAADLERSSGLGRLALEMGLAEVSGGDTIDAISAAVGLPAGADLADLADRLRDRGEDELVALLPPL